MISSRKQQVIINVETTVKDALIALATKEDLTMSKLGRKALIEYLKSRDLFNESMLDN